MPQSCCRPDIPQPTVCRSRGSRCSHSQSLWLLLVSSSDSSSLRSLLWQSRRCRGRCCQRWMCSSATVLHRRCPLSANRISSCCRGCLSLLPYCWGWWWQCAWGLRVSSLCQTPCSCHDRSRRACCLPVDIQGCLMWWRRQHCLLFHRIVQGAWCRVFLRWWCSCRRCSTWSIAATCCRLWLQQSPVCCRWSRRGCICDMSRCWFRICALSQVWWCCSWWCIYWIGRQKRAPDNNIRLSRWSP